ncbi:hypothetical protein [Mesorhizobium sp. B2-1-3A]|nr:hypothetical protein [Mesorhizobium sp. B2-1-3A]
MPFWIRDRLARRYRRLAHLHADHALGHRDRANHYEALADWLLPEAKGE